MTERTRVGGYSNLVVFVQPDSCWFCSYLHSNSWGLSLHWGGKMAKGEKKIQLSYRNFMSYWFVSERLLKKKVHFSPPNILQILSREIFWCLGIQRWCSYHLTDINVELSCVLNSGNETPGITKNEQREKFLGCAVGWCYFSLLLLLEGLVSSRGSAAIAQSSPALLKVLLK